jgi:uncharacterized protein YndB with AHSA1/START domain
MTEPSAKRRTDSASRVIAASPQTIYRAFLDPEAWLTWLPPAGMSGRIDEFEPREGGAFRMALTYSGEHPSVRGKTWEDTDVVEGRFLEFVPDERIIQVVRFESDDPAFVGEMRMTWSLSPVLGGTKVTITCETFRRGYGGKTTTPACGRPSRILRGSSNDSRLAASLKFHE